MRRRLTGVALERGLNAGLQAECVHSYRGRLRLRDGRIKAQKRATTPGLTVELNRDRDVHEAIDALCRFPKSALPPIAVQYTLQRENFEKLDRFVALAKRRGGKHLYIRVNPYCKLRPEEKHDTDMNEDVVPDYHLFIVARLIRDELYWLAMDPDPHAVWALSIDGRYKATLTKNPEALAKAMRKNYEKRRQSKSRVHGTIHSLRLGRGIVLVGKERARFRFSSSAIADATLRLIVADAVKRRREELVYGVKISCEIAKDPDSGEARATSLMAEQDLSPIKQTLFEVFNAAELAATTPQSEETTSAL